MTKLSNVKSIGRHLLPLLLLLVGMQSRLVAQTVLAGWDCNPIINGSNLFGPSPFVPTVTGANTSVGFLFRGFGVGTTGTGANRAFGGNNFVDATPALAIANGKFFTFTINAASGYTMSLSSINPFDYRRSSTGAPQALLQYSINAGTYMDITTISFPSTASTGGSAGPVDLSSVPGLQNLPSSSVVYFRIVPYGATGSTGTWYIFDVANNTGNDFAVNGTVSAPAASLTASPLTFPSICANATNVQNTTVSGSNLNGSSILIGPYSSFGFSLNPGGPFDPSLTLNYAGNTLPPTMVYVQYAPAAAGSNNGNIPMAGGGGSGSISATANANALPNVNATANPGTAFCPGSTVLLQGSGASTYTWNGIATLGSDTLLNPATASTYTVAGTDANGCTNSSTITLTQSSLPTVTASPATQTVCAGTQTLFNGGGADTYTWSGPQPITDATPFTVTGAHAGTYTVTGTATATGCTGTALATLNVTQFQPGPVNPEVLYYTFDGAGTTVPNQALTPPPGTANATIMGGLTQGGTGQTGGALIGSGVASSTDYLNTGWAPNLGNGAWTIAFWSSNFGSTAALYYIFGDIGTASFRCFTNGVAGPNNWILRGAGLTDITIPGGAVAGATHNAFVYDPIANNVKAYLNGVLVSTVSQIAPNLTGTGPLKVMGYSSNIGAPAGGKLDEFRIYNRAVLPAELLQLANYTGTFGATATPASVCAGANVTLNSSGVVSYTWNPGNLPGASVVVNPTSSTVYTVTGTDNNGCTGTLTTSVSVTIPPVVAAVSPASICLGGNVTFNGSGAVSYTWSDGLNTPMDAMPFTPPTAGTSTYTVTGTDGSGCTGTSTVGLTVHALPNVTATPATQTICENALATLSGGGAVSYVWSGGISDNTPFTVTSSNTYTVTGTDLNTCTNTATAVVTMNAAPAVTASITPATGCVNSVATPTAGGSALTYSWSGGLNDGQAFLIANGPMTYTVIGTDGNTCTASSSVLVSGTAASGNLPGATSNASQNHGDDLNASYYDASCNLIASVDDGAGGNILGLTTATVNVDANAGVHNGQPFVRRWYQITPASNGAADVQLYLTQADFDNYNAVVTLPYLPLPTGPADATGIANVRITKNADAGLGNSPVEITPVVTWNGSYWVLSFTTPSFSQFRVHSANPGGTPLPVALTKFDGRKLNSSNMLEWTTASEMNNAHFNLQYSTNGSDFATIAKVDSKAPNGMSSTTINYSFEHLTPALGHNYYRLQQVDLDNQSTLNAKVVDLIWGTNGSTVSIYPNPTQDVLNIDLYTSKVQNTTVKVLDMSGRIVKQIQARSEVGMNKLSISLGEVAGGIYTVQIFENDQLTHVDKVRKSDK